jgi:hydrogenase nickel incorporation protein HypA/HybF
MHEISLAAGLLQTIEQAAARENFRRVSHLRLEAGALAGVEPQALQFALGALAPGTCLESAEIDITQPGGSAWCAPCGAEVEIWSRVDPCPHCGGTRLRVTGGTQLRVLDLVVFND